MEKSGDDQFSQHDLLPDAEDANAHEHELTILEAIKLYPKAIAWSVIISTAIVMDGYDTRLMGSLLAQPAFQRAYGRPTGKKDAYSISAPWQSGLINGSNIGQLTGLVISGSISERLGFRKTMLIALIIIPGLVFIQFFAPSLAVLEVGQILLGKDLMPEYPGNVANDLVGVPLGMFQTVTTVYAIEVMPTCLRAYLTSYVDLCWVIGQLIAAGVLRGVLNLPGRWAYRGPFAIQWFWPMPLLIGVYLAPESPWWLVRQARPEDAKAAVRRLTSPKNSVFDVDKSVALMILTTEHERKINSSTHYLACFRGTDLRRTIIVIGCYCTQALSGNALRSWSTYFFEQAGLPVSQAFNMSIAASALGLCGVIVAWLLLPHVGRRTLFIWGLIAMGAIALIVGGLGIPQSSSPSPALAWSIGGLLLASVFVYNVTVGPVAFSLVSEIPSSLLRSKSVAIARFSFAALSVVANVIAPYQLNPTAWGWGARSGFFWGGTCALGLVFTWFFIPEPKDRTTAELDLLFARKVPAMRFAKTQVHVSQMAVDTRFA